MEIYAISFDIASCVITHYRLNRQGDHLYWQPAYFPNDMCDALINHLDKLGWCNGPTLEKVKAAAEQMGIACLGYCAHNLTICYREGDL